MLRFAALRISFKFIFSDLFKTFVFYFHNTFNFFSLINKNTIMDPEENIIKVAILTISDTRTSSKSNMETFDSSGHNLKQLINNYNVIESAKVVDYDCVTDDFEKIQAKMVEMCLESKVDVLLSTGGTGFAPRDVTPDATLGLVQKLTPGISHAIMNESLKITPMAMLSRAVAGIYNKTLIINLPGSKNASEQCLRVISYVIPHAVSLIKDKKEISKQFHNEVNCKTNNESIVPECVSKIACRHRESPFPKISIKSALNILKEQSFLQYNDNNKLMYPTVWIFSTGDELKCNEDKFSGYIRDTNSIMITQILEQDKYTGEVLNYGIVRDNWVDLCKKFEEAFNNADIVVTSGGVSMGEKDLIKHVLKEHFKCHIHFGRVDMKPGMPTTFVTLFFNNKKKYVFCLPGNPVSAGVCTHLFLLPFLRSVSGRKSIVHSFKARMTHDINNLDVRPEYRRALLKYQNGEFIVSCLTDLQQSSRLLSFVGSNCLLQLPSSTKQSKVKESTIMDVLLIKSIENTYIAPVLIEMNLEMVYQRQKNTLKNDNQQMSKACIKDILDLMSEHFLLLRTKNIPIRSAIGYVLHSPVNSLENLPPFEASIKDGYAIKYSDWSQKCNIFKVVQVSVAGTAPNCQEEICEKECARISTGAPLPPGTNCVVQVEDTSVLSKSIDGTVEMTIAILKEPKQFDNIRSIGSDISVGQRLLDEYTEIGSFEVALLQSVGCEQVCVYKYPDVHIIPYIDNSMYQTSAIIKNMINRDGFKGNVYTYSVQNELCKFDEKIWNLIEYGDIVIICSTNSQANNFCFDNINCNSSTYFYVYNNCRGISLGFSILYTEEKRIVMLHTTCYDSDSIYNCVHLFILPFLRMDTGKKQHISAIKTKSNYKMDLPTNKLSRAEFNYENGDFNVTCFTLNHQNCIIDHSSQVKNTINELDVIVTENSDSYLINY